MIKMKLCREMIKIKNELRIWRIMLTIASYEGENIPFIKEHPFTPVGKIMLEIIEANNIKLLQLDTDDMVTIQI